MKPLCRHLVTSYDQNGPLVTLFFMWENIKRNECKYFKSVSACSLLLDVDSINSAESWLQNVSVYEQTIFKQRILFKNVGLLRSQDQVSDCGPSFSS